MQLIRQCDPEEGNGYRDESVVVSDKILLKNVTESATFVLSFFENV